MYRMDEADLLFNSTCHHNSVSLAMAVNQWYSGAGSNVMDIKRSFSDFVIWPTRSDGKYRRNLSDALLGSRTKLDGIAAWLRKNVPDRRKSDRYVYIDLNSNDPAMTDEEQDRFSIQTNMFKQADGTRNTIYLSFPEEEED